MLDLRTRDRYALDDGDPRTPLAWRPSDDYDDDGPAGYDDGDDGDE